MDTKVKDTFGGLIESIRRQSIGTYVDLVIGTFNIVVGFIPPINGLSVFCFVVGGTLLVSGIRKYRS